MINKTFKKGIFTISLDVEMAWGVFDVGKYPKYITHFKNTRWIIDKLLKLFAKYKVSATWAVVGHLFLDSCQRKNGIAHEEIIRPKYKWFPFDWFSFDPCTNIYQDPFWYGKDIVEKIKKCEVPQEIASHSFSHIIFGDIGCSFEAAKSDIEECIKLAQKFDIKLETFIFPRNSIGYLEILKEKGFRCYRDIINSWYEKMKIPQVLKKFLRASSEFFVLTPPVSMVKKDKVGLFSIPGSMRFRGNHSIYKFLPIKFRVIRAKKGIKEAIKKKKIFHLYFHPCLDLGNNPKKFLEGLDDILKFASRKREEGSLEILSMKQICDLYEYAKKSNFCCN